MEGARGAEPHVGLCELYIQEWFWMQNVWCSQETVSYPGGEETCAP